MNQFESSRSSLSSHLISGLQNKVVTSLKVTTSLLLGISRHLRPNKYQGLCDNLYLDLTRRQSSSCSAYIENPLSTSSCSRQLTIKTSQTKKRKLSPQIAYNQDPRSDPDIPLSSVEDLDSQTLDNAHRLDIPAELETNLLQITAPSDSPNSSLGPLSFFGSSPSSANPSLILETDIRGDSPSLGSQQSISSSSHRDRSCHKSSQLLLKRRMMEGAAEDSQRSSSPLKRRASDLEGDPAQSHKDDLDMTSISSLNSKSGGVSTRSAQAGKDFSLDVLQEECENGNRNLNTDAIKQTKYSHAATTDIPDIDTQIKTVTSIIEAEEQRKLQEGDKVYLVSNRWLQRVKNNGTEAKLLSKRMEDFEIGPIDNSDITLQNIKDLSGTDFVQLRPGLNQSHFTPFPQTAWDLILEWYGIMPGTLPIIRTAHNNNPNGAPYILFEFYPLVFKIHRLYGSNNTISVPPKFMASNPDAPLLIYSRSTKWVEFLKDVKKHTRIEISKKIRVWRVPRQLPPIEPYSAATNTTTPPSSRPGSPTSPPIQAAREAQDTWSKLFLDVSTFLELPKNVARELLEADDVTLDPKYNGSRNLSMTGLGEDQTLVLDEYVSTGNNWVSNHTSRGSKSTSAGTRSGVSFNAQNSALRNCPAASVPMMTRGRAQNSGRTPGTVGLSNLGNTCYMNSALQCIRAVEELTKYFLGGAAMEELNRANPLGNNGDVAVAYQKLLEEIYHKDIVPSSIAPRHFRNTIGRYAPSFSGYGQQDSQEFLGFLLDGLQEDLSRVKKKPYIEKPDSTDEMVNNPEAIRQLAEKVWDITKKRDDSVIADLFTGMYKSTLVCPKCEKVSITFDPFNNLTLQLPIESIWTHSVFYFPLNDKPFTMTVEIEKQGTVLALKQFISTRVGVPAERLFAAEELKCKFYKLYKDSEIASDVIQNEDHLTVHELEASPTNWPPSAKLKKLSYPYDAEELEEGLSWDNPLAKRMLVPVFHRRPNLNTMGQNLLKSHRSPWIIDCAPHFIVLTMEEAQIEDIIRRKILEKVATLTTSTKFEDNDDAENLEMKEKDQTLDMGSDAELYEENRITASSIDGEDDVVDITMNDITRSPEAGKFESSAPPQPQLESTKPSYPFQSHKLRPKFLDSSVQLKPEFQNMFEIGYCQGAQELIPSGWNTIDEEKSYPSISSRKFPKNQLNSDDSLDENGVDCGSGITGSETGDEDTIKSQCATRMNDESESGDESVPINAVKALPVRTAELKLTGINTSNRKTRLRSLKSSPKKGRKQNRPKPREIERSEPAEYDNGPLIRLSEILVVDWNPHAYDTLFRGNTNGDDDRAQPTWNRMPTKHDDILQAKRKQRTMRKRNGITLDDCLNEFGKEEILSEMDTWYCPRCREHRRASKRFELWKTPDILIMHLKRFSSSARRRDKLDIRVDFPIEGLDLSQRVVKQENGKLEKYDLFAVDNHWGGLGGGHYTAHAKNFYDGEWYEYNDSSVSKQKNLSDIVSSSAYLLFYRRRSQVPLGGPKFQQIIEDYHNRISRSDDEASEPGEDQALFGNSSLRGSSSALIGTGAAQHLVGGFDCAEMTSNSSLIESLPAYESHEEIDEDAVHILGSQIDGSLHESIEDEGFSEERAMNHGSFNMRTNSSIFSGGFSGSEWGFTNVPQGLGDKPSGAGSDDELSSERAEHNSCPSLTSQDARSKDFESNIVGEDDTKFIEQDSTSEVDDENQMPNFVSEENFAKNIAPHSNLDQQSQCTTVDKAVDSDGSTASLPLEDIIDLRPEN
ncbi:ubiquitin carboxyl-terminal hydrolase/USP19 [Blumeria hordei DH14]|uniref:ubiquitinyl hydrolase 1 n=1 Tax=Blumeria graminis f. sp. hordei (strain DH14) TaxID=546991 RepID=N1JFM7_BLUG1|nr:ubiquitin carboxyl-terminal hydrolase/USP19 [Blumeria hordei DH14]